MELSGVHLDTTNVNFESTDLTSISFDSRQLCRQLNFESTSLGNFDLLSAKGIFLHMDLILWGFTHTYFWCCFHILGLFFFFRKHFTTMERSRRLLFLSLFSAYLSLLNFFLLCRIFLISSDPT